MVSFFLSSLLFCKISHELWTCSYSVGIVIKYENMSYKTAVHHAGSILSLHNKASRYIRDIFDQDNEVECIRLITNDYEMITAQVSNFTIALG